MTNQSNTPQPLLTDEEIMRSAINASGSLNITRLHEMGAPSRTIMDDAGLLELGRAIETAVLSKLRAPVADAQPVAYLHTSNRTLTWPGKLNEVQLASGVWRALYEHPPAPGHKPAPMDVSPGHSSPVAGEAVRDAAIPSWAPERIYLIETGEGVVWCDCPSPAPDIDQDDAVEYVRAALAQHQGEKNGDV